LVNVRHGQLHWDLAVVLRRRVGSGIARGVDRVAHMADGDGTGSRGETSGRLYSPAQGG
jgi:hypothetical protein